MANQNKIIIQGKVQKNSRTRFKIKKEKDNEIELDIAIDEIPGDTSEFTVDKLSIDGLPGVVSNGDGTTTPIRWFNNFSIKKGTDFINQKFKVTIPGLAGILGTTSRLVIFDGNGNPYYFTGDIINDTFELTDGDPATGQAP